MDATGSTEPAPSAIAMIDQGNEHAPMRSGAMAAVEGKKESPHATRLQPMYSALIAIRRWKGAGCVAVLMAASERGTPPTTKRRPAFQWDADSRRRIAARQGNPGEGITGQVLEGPRTAPDL